MSDWDSGTHAGPKMGRTLELARKEKGLSLEQAEEATKIRAGYLKELERDNFDVLPAVYVQGSLRTYANFLQLDGEALVQEFKRRQVQEPPYIESRDSDFLDRALRALGGAAVVGSQVVIEDEEDTGSRSLPAGANRYLYLVSGVFLVLILAAVALALTLSGDKQTAVSQVRAPLISQAPKDVGGEEDARVNQSQRKDEQGADDEGDDPRPEQSTRTPDAGDEGAGRTAQAAQANSSPAPAEPEAASTSPTTETPTRGSDASAPAAGPVNQNNEGPPKKVRGAGGTRKAPAGGSRRARPGSRNGGDFDVRIVVGSDDPVRITGDVPGVGR